MNDNKQSRKNFLKRLGLSFTGAAALSSAALAGYSDDKELIPEQKEFLVEYEQWLTEFQQYVNKRNENQFDLENNKKLMELSAASEERKTTLELYMKDKKFVDYFNQITQDITKSI